MMATEVPTLKNGGTKDAGKTIVMHLKRGLHWSNNTEITSADIEFGWQINMDAASGPACMGVSATSWFPASHTRHQKCGCASAWHRTCFRCSCPRESKKETSMSSTDATTSGRKDEAKGRIQEAVGDLTGNENQQDKGQANQTKGKLEQASGKAKDAIEDVKDAVSGG